MRLLITLFTGAIHFLMHRKWLVNRTNPEYVNYISKTASISPVLAKILINRGIKTADDIDYFLHPDMSKLSDPFEIADISKAVERIKGALNKRQKILIHGDYDADGVSAAAIIYQALTALGAECCYFIPNRFIHGYGFHVEGVRKAKEMGCGLIITVDCGITSFEAVDFSNKEGIDVIITDHHEPIASRQSLVNSEQSDYPLNTIHYSLPKAAAVVNPKLGTQNSKLAVLSGAGVALKLVQALAMTIDLQCTIREFLDLAAIGTIADVVPITGENRVIVSNGMPLINQSIRPGIMALLKVSGMQGREIKAGRISFTLIPRINAAGRIAESKDVVKLLTTDSEHEAEEIALWLDRLNSERQQIEEKLFQEALDKLNEKKPSSAIVLASEKWHQGVVGIVASRIAELFHKPAIIFSVENGIAKGSARSIPSFDICRALSGCSELLSGFGGHRQAAGVRLEVSKLDSFEKKLCSLFDSAGDIERTPEITIDADVNLSDINFSLIKEMEMLEPFGYGNPEPLLGAKMLEVLFPQIVGNNHLKMKLRYKSYNVDTIGFDMGMLFENLNLSAAVDAVFTPAINEWNGGRYLQLILKAFRPSV